MPDEDRRVPTDANNESPNTEPRPLLTQRRVAEIIGVEPRTIRFWSTRGLLAPIHLPTARTTGAPHMVRYDPADIERFIAERRRR